MKNILHRLLPTYRVAAAVETQLTEIQSQLQRMERENEALKKEVRNFYWLNLRREGETLSECQSRVFLAWPKAQGRLRELQMANLGLLKKIKAVCDRENLEFFPVFGTLLGAVRHQGFIPWDDDVDIGMFREDFLRLREILREDPLLRFDLYYNPVVGEICGKVKFRGPESFWVDIFMYDRVDVSAQDEEERVQRLRRTSEALAREQCRVLFRFYPEGRLPEVPLRDERMDPEMEKLRGIYAQQLDFYGHGEAAVLSVDMNPLLLGHVLLQEEAFPLRRDAVLFEGVRLPAFRNPEAYLKKTYGDYMQLPVSLEPIHSHEIREDLDRQLESLSEILGPEWRTEKTGTESPK